MSRRGKATPLERMTRASMPVDCNGAIYYFTPLALNELGLLEQWAKQEPYRQLSGKLKALGVKDGEDSPLLDKLLMNAERQSEDRSYIAAQLEGISGVTYGILLGFRVRHPNMTHEQLSDIIATVGFGKLQQLMEENSNLSEAEAKN